MYACLRNKIQQEVQHSVSCFFVEEDFIGVFGFVLKVNLPAHPWYNNSIVSSLGLLLVPFLHVHCEFNGFLENKDPKTKYSGSSFATQPQ